MANSKNPATAPLPLPIDALVPQILRTLEEGPALVLQASPGSGKTTRVPAALLKGRFGTRATQVWVLEPRRLAAKLAALRVAEELGEKVGQTVGYQFRFENVTSTRTQLLFLTEGMLLRKLLSEPTLPQVAAVVLDEFHERSLHGDVALSYLRWLQKTSRPDLRLVVLSATLDCGPVASFLRNCPILKSDTPIFPVDITYLPETRGPERLLDIKVKEAVASLAPSGGDCLVFLPGMADIRRAESALSPLCQQRGWRVFALHGDLPREEQEMALRPIGRPKVVLATNVAETSLTIEGITTVIDSGLYRQASYSFWSGIARLRTRPISKASAVQRAGRAGRLGPGRCLRLYTRGDFEARPPFETPEIQRADLSQTLLELKTLGIADPNLLSWLDAPAPALFSSAAELLFRLGALKRPVPEAALTTLGRRMAQFPAHPRLARLVLEGELRGVAAEAAHLAALVLEGQLDSLDALSCLERPLDPLLRRARESLLLGAAPQKGSTKPSRATLARCALAAFPDRVARKRKSESSRIKTGEIELVLSSGGSAKLTDTSLTSHQETFVVLELDETQALGQAKSTLRARSLVEIPESSLFDVEPAGIEERNKLDWENETQAVTVRSQLCYGALVLAETRKDAPPSLNRTQLLLRHGLGVTVEGAPLLSIAEWLDRLQTVTNRDALETLFARLEVAHKHAPELGVQPPNPLYPVLLPHFDSCVSVGELKAIDWRMALLTQAVGSQHRRFDELVPEAILLPSGRRAKVRYALGKAPWVESRLQDFFGWKTGPSIAAGRLPLTLHLLAPSQRPVQVTSDLASFWQRVYPAIRKELCRKYPKHAWPENPLQPKR